MKLTALLEKVLRCFIVAYRRAHTIKDTRTVNKPVLEPRRLSWQDFSSFGQ